jgi:hypothetical protein
MLQVEVAKAKSNKQITGVTNDDRELYVWEDDLMVRAPTLG